MKAISFFVWSFPLFCQSFVVVRQNRNVMLQRTFAMASSVTTTTTTTTTTSLSTIYPDLAISLETLGFVTPTPIQAASASLSKEPKNVLLIAPTGSGKTLAYLLPALTQAMNQDGTILVVAPTRELAVQLGRDAIM